MTQTWAYDWNPPGTFDPRLAEPGSTLRLVDSMPGLDGSSVAPKEFCRGSKWPPPDLGAGPVPKSFIAPIWANASAFCIPQRHQLFQASH